MIDLLDRQIVHALQIRGRAPFSLVGRVLGVSDQTVARRYARMRATGALRILGITDASLLGEVRWYVRARTAPGAARTIADAMARRSDTSWVQLVSGGTEIVCATRARASADPDSLLAALPRSARVLDVTAQCELHVYSRSARSLLASTGALAADQVEELRAGDPAAGDVAGRDGVLRLDEVDRALLEALRHDARAPLRRLAAATGAPAAAVRHHLERLQASGALSFDAVVDPDALGLSVLSLLWITVAPKDLEATGTALATHPEAVFVAATTGRSNLFATVLTRDTAGLYSYLTRRVATLPAVRDVESVPTVRSLRAEARA